MCGRYFLDPENEIYFFERFGVDFSDDGLKELAELFRQRFNCAPTQSMPVVRDVGGGPKVEFLRWGLVPSWADDPKIGARMINARSETAAVKPSFKRPLAWRRCIVPATGFYEWKREGKSKRPYAIRRNDDVPMAFAGIWERNERASEGGAVIESYAILTVESNADMQGLHDRMPVILEPKNYKRWLDPGEREVDAISELMAPAPVGTLCSHPVAKTVGNVRNEGPELAMPLTKQSELF